MSISPNHSPYSFDTIRNKLVAAAAAGAVLLGPTACAAEDEPRGNYTPSVAPESPEPTMAGEPVPSQPEKTPRAEGLRDPIAQKRAAQIMSTFENSTTEIQYGYAENIQDGRGITAGRAGFCSGTGDMLMVVEKYTDMKPDNGLAKYLPRLREIDEQFAATGWEDPVGATRGLEGLEQAWEQAAESDKAFLKAQDAVFDELYLEPALEVAKNIKTADGKGIRSAIGQLIMVDANMQHGAGTDPDGLPAIMDETTEAVGPAATEAEYLAAFLDIRQKHLENAADPDTREAWRESVPRVEALRQILESGNHDLRGELVFDVYQGDHYELPAVK